MTLELLVVNMLFRAVAFRVVLRVGGAGGREREANAAEAIPAKGQTYPLAYDSCFEHNKSAHARQHGRLTFRFSAALPPAVKLQRLAYDFFYLFGWRTFGKVFIYALLGQPVYFPLIWLFFGEYGEYNVVAQSALLAELLDFYGLCKRWGAILAFHRLMQRCLFLFG